MMTRQEMFDKAASGLKSQGFTQSRSYTPGGKCLYNQGEKHCAFGWLITDVPITEAANSASVRDLIGVEKFASLGMAERFGSDDETVDFLTELQRCHDRGCVPADMESRLRKFASSYRLSTAVLDGTAWTP